MAIDLNRAREKHIFILEKPSAGVTGAACEGGRSQQQCAFWHTCQHTLVAWMLRIILPYWPLQLFDISYLMEAIEKLFPSSNHSIEGK